LKRRTTGVSGRETILVVEDETSVRNFVLMALRTNGYHTVEAFDGESGFSSFLAHRQEIGLILSDVVMPRSRGPEMVLKILQTSPFLPVGFVSGTADLNDLPESLHFIPILRKPFTASQLLQFIRRVIDERRAATRK